MFPFLEVGMHFSLDKILLPRQFSFLSYRGGQLERGYIWFSKKVRVSTLVLLQFHFFTSLCANIESVAYKQLKGGSFWVPHLY